MAEPEADGCDVDEATEAFGGFVVAISDAASILEPVEASLDEVSQSVEPSVNGDTKPARLAHWDHRHDVACLHGSANPI